MRTWVGDNQQDLFGQLDYVVRRRGQLRTNLVAILVAAGRYLVAGRLAGIWREEKD